MTRQQLKIDFGGGSEVTDAADGLQQAVDDKQLADEATATSESQAIRTQSIVSENQQLSGTFDESRDFKAGPACRTGLLPEAKPARRDVEKSGRIRPISCNQVAASREVPLGKRDLLELLSGRQHLQEGHSSKSTTAPLPDVQRVPRFAIHRVDPIMPQDARLCQKTGGRRSCGAGKLKRHMKNAARQEPRPPGNSVRIAFSDKAWARGGWILPAFCGNGAVAGDSSLNNSSRLVERLTDL